MPFITFRIELLTKFLHLLSFCYGMQTFKNPTQFPMGKIVSSNFPVSTWNRIGRKLLNQAVDKNSGCVYVSGVNRLYQLSHDLELQKTVDTGRHNDSDNCIGDKIRIKANFSSISLFSWDLLTTGCLFYPKALTISYRLSKLINCEMGGWGHCELRDLKNINSEPVVFKGLWPTSEYYVARSSSNRSEDEVRFTDSSITTKIEILIVERRQNDKYV